MSAEKKRSPAPLVLLTALCVAVPAAAWDGAGHREIAAVAYDRLSSQARAKVGDLLRRHPDFGKIETREAFLAAANWPDLIKRDPRFTNETRHGNWHYVDRPYSPDGTRGKEPTAPNLLTELRRLVKGPVTPGDLPWIEHLVGDAHQPLHCVSRFTKLQEEGDQGGNKVFVRPDRNLHLFWDEAAGTNEEDRAVDRYASAAMREYPEPRGISLNPNDWIEEGYRLAQSYVYTFGLDPGSKARPIVLSPRYEEQARSVARERIAMAGYRLAGVLNQLLK